jgi:hypothetical protein
MHSELCLGDHEFFVEQVSTVGFFLFMVGVLGMAACLLMGDELFRLELQLQVLLFLVVGLDPGH